MIIGSTLGRYLSLRFFNTIMAVFLAIIGMVYVFDFVEMLRRYEWHARRDGGLCRGPVIAAHPFGRRTDPAVLRPLRHHGRLPRS